MSAELTLSSEDRIMLVEIASVPLTEEKQAFPPDRYTCKTVVQNSPAPRTVWADELDFEPLCIVITAKPDMAVRKRAQVLADTHCFNDKKVRATGRSMRHYKSDDVRRDQYVEDHVRIVRVRELERDVLSAESYRDITIFIEPKEKVQTER